MRYRPTRRTFIREMKLASVERLETGTSIAAVARAFAVNPNVLHGWQREFRHGSGQCFPGAGKRRWDERPPLGPNPPTARPASRRRSSALPCACSAICLFPFLSLKSYSMACRAYLARLRWPTGFPLCPLRIGESVASPVITISISPKFLWPPNRKIVPVTVSGMVSDTGCTIKTAAYAVKDEYGEVQPRGPVILGAPGALTVSRSGCKPHG